MKTLADGKEVPARSYYYLLDWNEINERKYIFETFNTVRLCDLNSKQYYQLFVFATHFDALKLIENI